MIDREILLTDSWVRQYDLGLYAACKYAFGNWNATLLYLGFDPEVIKALGAEARGEYTPDRVVAEIHSLRRNEVPLWGVAVSASHPKLYAAAHAHHRGWRWALLAAGLDPKAIARAGRAAKRQEREAQRPTRTALLSEVRRRHQAGEPVTPADLRAAGDWAFIDQLNAEFRTGDAALTAAGLSTDVAPRRRRYEDDPARIPRLIRARWEAGLPCWTSAVRQQDAGLQSSP